MKKYLSGIVDCKIITCCHCYKEIHNIITFKLHLKQAHSISLNDHKLIHINGESEIIN
jgi:hypothetical protein